MPLIKVHISTMEIPANKPLLVKKLREIMVEKLKIDEKKGEVVLYEAFPQHRAIYADRSKNFIFIEVLLNGSQPREMKQELINSLVETTSKIMNIDIKDINCCLLEIPKENWFEGK